MQKVKLTYKKGEEVRFIGHLDMVRVFQRALRRADLPISYTEGFNPHPKISFGPALKLGLTSEDQTLTLTLEKPLSLEEIKLKLDEVLPAGISILTVAQI